jgi:hypothetical protein
MPGNAEGPPPEDLAEDDTPDSAVWLKIVEHRTKRGDSLAEAIEAADALMRARQLRIGAGQISPEGPSSKPSDEEPFG